jgi:two-component system response regulator RegA
MAKRAELLLVDASLGQRALLQRILASHGFSVTTLAGLRQAAAAIAVQSFDHAVLDLRLPDRDGLSLVRTLRERHPQTRIVVVTDADSFATVVLALRAGADGFVPKPVDEGELIDALFDRAPSMPPVPQTPLGLHRTCWEHVMRVYEQCDRNMTHAAERLGMHRRSLQRFLSKRAPPARALITTTITDDRLMPAHLAGVRAPANPGNLFDR